MGDAIAAVTKAAGVEECDGCRRRRAACNEAVPFDRAKLLAKMRERRDAALRRLGISR